MTDNRPVDLDLRWPFTRAAALAAGVNPWVLRGPDFRRVLRGVYIQATVPAHPLIRTMAALLIHPPDAFASHLSAARLYELPVPYRAEEHVSVFDEADRRRRAEIRNHIAPAGAPVEVLHGVRVSAPTQLFLELADELGLVDLVVAGDALVRRKGVSPDDLVAAALLSGHRFAQQAAAFVRERVDSAMETRLRMLIVLAGLPEPKVNHKLYYEDGRLRYRLDLSYPDLKLIVEYDGRQHREDEGQWNHDVTRREWFDHNGWMLVPVFSRGIYKRPDETVDRVHRALRSRGCTDLPRVLSDDWRRHFPVRH